MAYGTITAPAEGAVLPVDTIGGTDFPRTKISFGAEGSVTDVNSGTPLPVSITGSAAVTGTFWQATQPVSIANPVAVTGTFWQATQPISAASLPLPTGAGTAANQATAIAAIATIGTRAYGNAETRVAYAGTSAQSAAITATEVLLHNCGTARCYVKAASNPTATVNDIPIEAGEKFHLRITSGHKIAALQDSAGGNLNIVPVA